MRHDGSETTPTFILELPLVVSSHEARILSVRFECGRQLYNAVLGEALRRLDLMKQSKAWQVARKMPSDAPGSPAAEFSLIAETIGLTHYDIQAYATRCKNACWMGPFWPAMG
jgi:hypothetical protein